MGIVMPTVRHTGSLFMVGLLREFKRIAIRGNDNHQDVLVFDHVYDRHMPHFHKWIEKYPTVVIPLRDPTTVALSWAKRGERFDWFYKMWNNLSQFEQYNPIYVPIDRPERDIAVRRLSEAVRRPINTDWNPHNQSEGVTRGIPDISEIYAYPAIERFYGSP